MSIHARKLKNGKTVYDAILEYGTSSGVRVRESKTFQTKAEAKAAEEEARRYRDAASVRTGKIRLSEYIDRHYMPIASRRLQPTSLETYEREIDKRIKPYLGNFFLEDIDRRKIQRMVDSCKTEAVGRKAVATLKTILNEAVGDGFINGNPATARFAFPPKGRNRDNGLVLSDFGQIAQFIEDIQKDAPEPIVRLVMAGLMLGLRPEERYALDYEDFDFANGTVMVRNAYVTVSSKHGGNQLKSTKTKLSKRLIPMPQPFIDWFYWEDEGSGPWIKNRDGNRLSPSTGRKMWARYLRDHPDLPQVTLENMRHSFATSCLHAGMNVEDLSRMLGHSDINTTFRRYVKPDLKNMREGLSLIPYPD